MNKEKVEIILIPSMKSVDGKQFYRGHAASIDSGKKVFPQNGPGNIVHEDDLSKYQETISRLFEITGVRKTC